MATSDKYDRQLRLWGANGQRALMSSHLLLVHADSCGSETLKNLVLPGVGAFTIVDDFTVEAGRDLGCNFFVDADSIDRPRAEVVTELLCEMNSDVKGTARVANFQNILQTEPEYLQQFSLIIASNLPEQQLLPLAQLCWRNSQPLVAVRSCGFVGFVRLQLVDHSIVESKVEADKFDLRISNPFPALAEFCERFSDLRPSAATTAAVAGTDAGASMDSLLHAHVPYVAILYHALQQWQNQHDGKPPSNFAEKESFKRDCIKAMARDLGAEVNFQEAVRESYRAYSSKTPSHELQLLLQQSEAQLSELTPSSADFEFLTAALAEFVRASGDSRLPLSGAIPDMTATTELYVQLQQIFQQQAAAELQQFRSLLHTILERAGAPMDKISAETVADFCRNAQSVMRVRTAPLQQQLLLLNPQQTGASMREVLQDELYEDPAQTPLLWYLALRAGDRFFEKHGRWPGSYAPTQQLAASSLAAVATTNTTTTTNATAGEADGSVMSAALEATLEADRLEVLHEMRHLCEVYAISDLVDTSAPADNMDVAQTATTTAIDSSGSGDNDAAAAAATAAVAISVAAHALEVVRYGGAEIHATSAVVGGVAAQEVVKILTHQYVPLNSTYVFNGIASCGATYAI